MTGPDHAPPADPTTAGITVPGASEPAPASGTTPGTTPGTVTQLSEALAERYQVERPLGRGGMATVYLARDRKHDRAVAVKVLHPELAASIGGERFLREIRLAATLQHPHVLGLYDSGSAGGLLYYVMPFVDGESLRDRLRRESQLPIDDALRLAAEVASALGYAHAQGIVHRDVKPENVLLASGHAIVADFGIARAVTSAGAEKLTETGMALGTPQYMSPEQGTGGETGPASDVYALGCVLFEMLAGEPPFTGPNAMAVIAKHAMTEVPSLRTVRGSVPPDVEALVRRALAKSPADRWPNAAEFEKALRLAMARTTTTDFRVDDAGARAASRARGLPRWALLAVGAGVAATAAGAAVVLRARTDRPAAAAAGLDARRLAVLRVDAPAGDAELQPVADGLTDALADALRTVPGLTVPSANATRPLAGVPVDSAARALAVGAVVTGRLEPEAGDRLRLTLTLRDASGAAFADTSLVRPRAELLALRDDAIDQAGAMIRQRLGAEVALRATRAGTTSADAWALVQRALGESRRAATLLQAGDTAGRVRADAAADALFAQAAERDPRWAVPHVEHARHLYRAMRRNRATGLDPAPLLVRAMAEGDAAVAIDSSAAAFGARGIARYWAWLIRVGSPDLGARQVLASSAQSDLERATRLDPGQADAWRWLSHYYVNFRTLTDAKLAAVRAYDTDPFLSDAEGLLDALASQSFELGQFEDLRRYCTELQRRFPTSARGAECELKGLAADDAPRPSAAQVWEAHARLVELTALPTRPAAARLGSLYAAMALGRAGLTDSARAVIARVIDDPAAREDAGLQIVAAFAYLSTGDRARALERFRVFAGIARTSSDQMRRTSSEVWFYRDVRSDPEFRRIFGL
ncbi:protein kinase domain-containing protein [Roseisolibacter agri]|uniref:non-specific serine/threonine protein kinase n=1 Tax=Roseisolibacter agri TaxID=2014610 RepID=A0AA37Q2Z0_9BACT|nr:serine/threonine-protein kinase [Roseisolibacter agri]GLC25434.1 hypothetical protein rosag_19470 [Roseisolibacter agri]